ncbi:MAG: hypothetical protein AB7O65_09825 [Candidatus Korobacteraceae bacterium]
MDANSSDPQEAFDPYVPIATLLSEMERLMLLHDNQDGCLNRMLRLAELQAHYGEAPLPPPPLSR